MKKLMTFALACALAATFTAPVLALGPFDAEAELPVYSKYVWRGMVTVDDYVLQPSVNLGLLGFELGFWGNVDMTDINSTELTDTSWKFTEIDWTLGYTLGLPLFELGGGFIYYTFPQLDDASTVELYLAAKANVILSPSLTFYQDLDAIKGAYWDLNVGHGFALGETSKLNVTAGLGLGSQSYIEGYFTGPGAILDPANMVDLGASVADFRLRGEVPFHPVPFFTVTPSVTYTTLMGDPKKAVEADENLWYGKKDAFFWGLSVAFKF